MRELKRPSIDGLFIISIFRAAILAALTPGWFRLANMPAEVIQRSLDGFKVMEAVDEVKTIAPLNQFAHSDLFTAESDAAFAGFTFPIADTLRRKITLTPLSKNLTR